MHVNTSRLLKLVSSGTAVLICWLASQRRAFNSIAIFLLLGLAAPAFQADEEIRTIKQAEPVQLKAVKVRAVSADQQSAAQLAEKSDVKAEWHPQLGTPLSIRGSALSQRRDFSGGKGLVHRGGQHEQNAIVVMDNLARFYGLRDAEGELTVKKVEQDSLGFSHVRLTQRHGNLRVVGGDLIVHFDKTGEAYQVNGPYVPDIQIKGVPKLKADEAALLATRDLAALGKPPGTLEEKPVLVVYARNVEPQLAYELTLTNQAPKTDPGRWHYWINADSGEVILRYNDIKKIAPPTANGTNAIITGSILTGEGGSVLNVTGWFENAGFYYLHNTNRHWTIYNVATSGYPDYNTYAYRATANWATSDRTEMSAAGNFDLVQRYYLEVQGRNSFNNAGIYARANVHLDINYVNAYWDGSAFYFGDGDGVVANSLAVLDVSGHEYTHAVDQYTADLIYSGESGALNESFSDIMGTCIEFWAEPDGRTNYPAKVAGTADWLCGEDCWLSSVALRDLRNPQNAATVGADHEQPSRYKGTYWDPLQEVHQNSGVQNFFFYLLSEGGSGNNDGIIYGVTGIGVTNAEQVAYRALTVYCTPSTDYQSVRSAWISAALDLNTNWASSVSGAWSAVGVGPLLVTPDGALVFRGPVGGSFSPATQTYALFNRGTDSMTWSVTHTQSWATVSPTNGTIAANGSNIVTVAINPAANGLPMGIYTDALTFSNSADASLLTRQVKLLVGQPDYFTELFDAADNDLDFQTWTFTPNGSTSFYSVCRETAATFPTDPTGGTTVSLSDDSYAQVTLTGTNTVAIYSRRTNVFYIGSNGYLTMNSGDSSLGESFTTHFNLPRVAACFDDLNPSTSGTVSWKQTTDLAAVTFSNVREYGTTATVSFQIEMFYDGRIRLTYLGVGITDGLAGLSAGSGVPADFTESDFTSYGACAPPDDLVATPSTGLISQGYQGGPFTPLGTTYTLSNIGTNSLIWSVTTTQPWLTVSATIGSLTSSASTNIAVDINSQANSLTPGLYTDTVTFSNLSSGFVQTRSVSLRVLPIPGEIGVSDSIPPDTDLDMPFGEVIVGLSRTEQITVTNTDNTHDLIISGIGIGGASSPFRAGGTPLVVTLPGVSPRYPAQAGSYLPTDYSGTERPPMTLEVKRYQPASSSLRVLIVAAGDNPTVLRTGLAGFPDIAAVNYFDARVGTPTLAQLSSNDVVLVMSDSLFLNSAQMGDVLADYVDGGGAVVEGVAAFATGGGWELTGRLVTGGYEPFIHGAAEFIPHSLGTNDASHPIMQGVSTVTDGLIAAVSLRTNAQWVASWNNGRPLAGVATRGVVGINVFAFDTGDFTGNVVLLFHNAIVFSVNGGAFSLANLPTLPHTVPPAGSLTFDIVYAPTSAGSNAAAVMIESNDADEPRVKVQLTGQGILDYLRVLPVTDFAAQGHPGGLFSPSSATYVLSNASPMAISWATSHTQTWVNVSPASGTLAVGQSESVTVDFTAAANSLSEGAHHDAVIFTNLTTTVSQQRNVSLTVFTSPQIVVSPLSMAVTNVLGSSTNVTLIISNTLTADANLTFSISAAETGRSILSLAAAGVGLPPTDRDFTKAAPDKEFTRNQLLVRFAVGVQGLQRSQMLNTLGGAQVTREYKVVPGLCLVKLPAGQTVEQALLTYNRTAGVLYAEPDYQLKALATIPNDARFSELWGMHNTGQTGGTADADIDAPEAWTLNTGNRQVVVAVIDTGVDYTHPDLTNNIWTNPGEIPGNGIDDDGNGFVDDVHGYDFVNNDGNPMDDHYHGTHVSGTIGAEGNNGIGVAGVCWQARIMALKFLDAGGSGYTANAISCVEYATLMGARVMNNSWGGGPYEQSLKDAIDAAGAAGSVFVAAAGNAGSNNDTTPSYPASYASANIISVMSTDHNDVRSSFSCYGLVSVDVAAPGSSILSCQPGGLYQKLSGTSMATPHVVGACALLLAANPILSVADIKQALQSTVDPTLPGQCVSGGRINLARALASVGAAWITVTPAGATNIVPGAAVNVTVGFQAGELAAGTYSGQLVIACNDLVTPPVPVPVTMTILPEDLQVTPTATFASSGAQGGPFAPSEMVYTLTNAGASALNWEIAHTQSWVGVSASSGTLAGGASLSVTGSINSAASLLVPGTYVDTLVFSNSISGAVRARAVALSVVTPVLSIADASVLEGDVGSTNISFTVSLTPPTLQTVTIAFATSNGTAQAGSDYVATSGMLTFAPGQTTTNVIVMINGDTNAEPNETFFVNLTAPSNALLARAQATGTILTDDGLTLAQALDTPGWTWLTGATNWLGQTTNTHDGVDAGQSGLITHSQETWMETTVQGPGTVTFWWSVSSESSFDYLEFRTNGVLVTRISGTVGWTWMSNRVASGAQTLRWRYMKDSSVNSGQDKGWVDQVSFVPDGPTPPYIVQQPVSQTVRPGTNATFCVTASGSLPLNYQWRKDGTNLVNGGRIVGATNACLTISSVVVNDSGQYSVLVTNTFGATNSADATLLVSALDHFAWSAIGSPQYVNVPFTATITAADYLNSPITNFNGCVALASVAGQTNTIGSGSNTVPFPLGTYYHDERSQVIYQPGEIGGAGRITALALDVATLPGQVMNYWTIRIKHTSLSAYTNNVWEGSGWTVVYQTNLSVTATGWLTFPLTTPFDYNGVDSLMVDFSFNNSSYTSDGYCRATARTGVRALYYYTDSGYGDPLTWSGSTPTPITSSYTPNLRLVIGSGSSVPIQPVVACFSNGVCTTNLMVQVPATNLILRADDGIGHSGLCNPFNVLPANPPVILAQPTSQTVRPGTNITFCVTANGTLPLSYQWRKDGTNLVDDGDRIAGATNPCLTISSVLENDSGQYSVLVTNICGATNSADATLLVSALDHFVWDNIPSLQPVGTPFAATVTARDVFGGVASNFTGTVALNGSVSGLMITNTILGSPVHASSSSGSYTLGHAFTPSNNLTVTHVRSYSGTKVSIWTDAGVLLGTQNISGAAGVWTETPLPAPLSLAAGSTYRVAFYTGGGVYYMITNRPSTFPNGTLVDGYYYTTTDAFPTTFYSANKVMFLCDLRYTTVGASVTVSITPTNSGNFVNGVWIGDLTVPQLATNISLRANDGIGHTGYSNPFDVLPANPPVILAQPVSQTARPGTNITFCVTASETLPLSYQWRKDGTNLVNGGRIAGATNPCLTISSVLENDAGQYSVLVTNICGATNSADATLLVSALDHFAWSAIGSPQNVNVPFAATITAADYLNRPVTNFNGTVALSAFADGGSVTDTILNGLTHTYSDSAYDYTMAIAFTPNTALQVTHVRHYSGTKVSIWTDAGELLTSQTVVSTPGTWAETALTTPITLTAGTQYRVGAFYPAGTDYYYGDIVPATFTNGTIGFACYSDGDEFPLTDLGTDYLYLVDLRYTVGTFVAVTITPTNSGNFVNGVWIGDVRVLQAATNLMLTANDGAGHTGSSNPFNVAQGAPPSITAQPASVTTDIGATVSFSVTASGTAPLSYFWRLNATPIPNATNSTYTTNNVQLADSGSQFSCLVSNAYGFAISSNATLLVNSQPTITWQYNASSKTLELAWSGTGFHLQSQTNNLGVGLSTNWFDYPGGTNSPVIITPNPANPAVFYRLRAGGAPTNNLTPTNRAWIPAGSFTMGSPASEALRLPDETQHSVTLTQGFYMGKYEVTQGQYLAVTGSNPSQFTGDLNRPVEMVSWHDATNRAWRCN